MRRVLIPSQAMDEGPVDFIEDYLDRIIGLDLKGCLIGGESKLIGCSHGGFSPQSESELILSDMWG